MPPGDNTLSVKF